MQPRHIVITVTLIVLGAFGGWIAGLIHLPMSWLLGSLALSATMVLTLRLSSLDTYVFPEKFRSLFISIIGVMIGTQVSVDLLSMAGDLVWTLGALAIFVLLAHLGNTVIFQKLGGYDRATAFYAGTPGGLMESILMGESAGANTAVLVAQQFLRIIVVLTLLPLGLSLWVGAPVGSAAGLSIAGSDAPPVGPIALVFIMAAAWLGQVGARKLRLPAAPLTGPLLISAIATSTGMVDLHLPIWLVACAQVVIGVSLGLRFKGIAPQLLRRSVWLSLVSVLYMMALGAGFAVALHAITGIEFLHLLISFAPGGVAEMSVVALSLAANPALVSLHHVARILLTVITMGLLAKVVGLSAKKPN